MKIIFDSEEQKDMFLNEVGTFRCPHNIGVGTVRDCPNIDQPCLECWQNCGIEMEVAKEKKYRLIYGNAYVRHEEITTHTVFDGPDMMAAAMDFLHNQELVRGVYYKNHPLPHDWYDEHKGYMKLSRTTRNTVEHILDKIKDKLDAIKESEE